MSRLSNNNAQGEYYLTDVIAMAVSDGLVVATGTPPLTPWKCRAPTIASNWLSLSVTISCALLVV